MTKRKWDPVAKAWAVIVGDDASSVTDGTLYVGGHGDTNWIQPRLVRDASSDGTGSGMDTDLLDGLDSTAFVKTDNADLTGSVTGQVSAMSGIVLDPGNGTIQTKIVTGNVAFSDGLSSGQSMTLILEGAGSYTVTWPNATWATGAAPTLTARDVVVLFKVGAELMCSYTGSIE